MKIVIGFFLALSITASSFSQQYFVEFIVDEVDTFNKAKEVEIELRSNSDYQLVRMDFNTGRCYIILEESIKKSEPYFRCQFKKQGYEISCFYTGVRGKDPFIDINRGRCD